MYLFAHIGLRGYHIKEIVIEVLRVRRGKPEPYLWRHIGHPIHQLSKADAVPISQLIHFVESLRVNVPALGKHLSLTLLSLIMIRIDVLPEEGDLSEALVSQISDLVLYRGRRSAPLSPSSKGDDAEAAHVIAPSHDGYPGVKLILILPYWDDVGISLIKGELDIHGSLISLFRLDYLDQARQVPISIRPCHQVNHLVF